MESPSQNIRKIPEYFIWKTMRARCRKPYSSGFHKYGAKGIDVCDRWYFSYEDFLQDMGRRPSASHSIERVDNSKGYAPDNCVWATRSQQAHNKGNFRNNTSGCKGVSFYKNRTWMAYITVGNKRQHLGYFSDFFEACCSRKSAENKFWI